MRKAWAVARREFLERVRSRWFWISAVLGPAFFAAVFFLPLLLSGSGGAKHIALVDGTSGGLGTRAAAALAAMPGARVTRVPARVGVADSLSRLLGDRRLDGVLILTDDVLDSGTAEFRTAPAVSPRDLAALERALGRVVIAVRLEREGVDPAVVARAQRRVPLTVTRVAGAATAGQSSAQSFSLAYFSGLILYTAILAYGVSVKSSVLEEKTSHIVEVLLSSVRPFPLLAGKVAGVGAVSLFQFLIWGVAGRLLLGERAALATRLGGGDGVEQLFQVPRVAPATAAVFLAYFVAGFLLYAALFAVVGAISSSEQEAQQAQQPIVYTLVLALIGMFAVIGDPASTLSRTLSLVPLTAPIVMPVRWAAGSVPTGEFLASLLLLGAGIVGVTWAAARIYRVGVLMTGKRPGPRELLRWMRAS
jgi:ABC-2 type transport system permease protein